MAVLRPAEQCQQHYHLCDIDHRQEERLFQKRQEEQWHQHHQKEKDQVPLNIQHLPVTNK